MIHREPIYSQGLFKEVGDLARKKNMGWRCNVKRTDMKNKGGGRPKNVGTL